MYGIAVEFPCGHFSLPCLQVYHLKQDIPSVVAAVVSLERAAKRGTDVNGVHPPTNPPTSPDEGGYDLGRDSLSDSMATRARSSALLEGLHEFWSGPALFGGTGFRRMSDPSTHHSAEGSDRDQMTSALENLVQVSSAYVKVPSETPRGRGGSIIGTLLPDRCAVGVGVGFEELREEVSVIPLDQDWGDVDIRDGGSSRPCSYRGQLGGADVSYQGYLRKLTRDGSRSQRRYFVLSNDKLLYFADKQDTTHVSNIRGTMSLSSILSVDMSSSNPCNIKVTGRDRCYNLSAYTEVEAQTWQEKLLEGMQSVHSCAEDHMSGAEKSATLNRRKSLMSKPTFCGGVGGAKAQSTRRASLTLEVSMPAAALSLREKKGFLRRRHVLYWQERWFELLMPGQLMWYATELDHDRQDACGRISMADVLSVSQSTADPCCLDIDLKGLTLELQADSAGLAQEWYEALISWVQHAALDIEKALSRRRSSVIVSGPVEERIRTEPVTASAVHIENYCGEGDLRQLKGHLELRLGESDSWQDVCCELTSQGVFSFTSTHPSDMGNSEVMKWNVRIEDILIVEKSAILRGCFALHTHDSIFEFRASRDTDSALWVHTLLGWMKYTVRAEQNSATLARSSCDFAQRTDECTHTRYRRSDTLKSNATDGSVPSQAAIIVLREKAGVVRKRSGIWRRSWQSRYLTLRRPGVLSWFLDSEDEVFGNARGWLHVKDVLAVEPDASGGTSFDVCVKGRSYEFCAATDAECVEWIDAISAWAKFAYNTGGGVPIGEEGGEVSNYSFRSTLIEKVASNVYSSQKGAQQRQSREDRADTRGDVEMGYIGRNEVSVTTSLLYENEGDNRENEASTDPPPADTRCSDDGPSESSSRFLYGDIRGYTGSDDDDGSGTDACDEDGLSALHLTDTAYSHSSSSYPLSEAVRHNSYGVSVCDSRGSGEDGSVDSGVTSPAMPARQSFILRRSSKLPKAWIDSNIEHFDDSDEETTTKRSDLPSVPISSRPRRASDIADTVFIRINSQCHDDDFVNKLKTNSYRDLSEEYWLRHKWYLAMVVCFVTLQVLRVTSFILRDLESGF